MKKRPLIILLAIVGVIVIAGVGMYLGKSYQTAPSSQSSSSTAPITATISYVGSGFIPASTTVKSGDSITIKNNSDAALQFQSNPHPTHTDDNDLNVGEIKAGESKTIIVVKKGEFGFHNHLNPAQQGKITIN